MIFWLPISVPMGFLLDKIVGHREGTYYSRPGLFLLTNFTYTFARIERINVAAW